MGCKKTDAIPNYTHSFIVITLDSDYIFNLAIFFKKINCFNESILDSDATYTSTRKLIILLVLTEQF